MGRHRTILFVDGTAVTTSWLSNTLSILAGEPVVVSIEDDKVCLSSYSLKTESEYLDLLHKQGFAAVGFKVHNFPKSDNPKVFLIAHSDIPVEPSVVRIQEPIRRNKKTFNIQPTITMTKDQFEDMMSGIVKRPVSVHVLSNGIVDCFYQECYLDVDLQICKDYIFKSQGYEVAEIHGLYKSLGDGLIQIILKSPTTTKIKL